MIRRVAFGVWLLYASGSGVAEGLLQEADFCARAQGMIAESAVVPAVGEPADWEAFVDSKATDQPFEVQQYYSSHLAGNDAPHTVVSCKMRTAERVHTTQASDGSDSPPAGVESSCDAILRAMLAEAYTETPAAAQAVAADAWQVAEEEVTFMGPMWLEPWPFVPVVRGEGGALVLHSRALYVPYSRWIPAPSEFLGNYYCHLVAPSYLQALVRGEQPLP